ncbi:hypothetical protein Scep_009531 [Stephania cephalantha]|uniref:Pentatricopeptide repeat-containing protein n=1 Tax=Stephania cephalantha TaxID=152367 RepID=A0AAP0JUD5_9MAGN
MEIVTRDHDFHPSRRGSALTAFSGVYTSDQVRDVFDTEMAVENSSDREMCSWKDVISWSCMMACCVKNEMAGEALNLFHEIVEKRLTLVSALQACAAGGNVGECRRIHELARRKGFELDVLVSNSLIDMYMKCSCIDEAIGIFHKMPEKDVVLWATLMSGYTLTRDWAALLVTLTCREVIGGGLLVMTLVRKRTAMCRKAIGGMADGDAAGRIGERHVASSGSEEIVRLDRNTGSLCGHASRGSSTETERREDKAV